MAVLKKHLTPIGKKGPIIKHAGKGSKAFSPPAQPSINDYSKQTPMANPAPDAPDAPAMPMPGMMGT